MNNTIFLNSEKIIETIDLLEKRINDRFPDSGLKKVCSNFLDIARKSKMNIAWISKPNILIRIFTYLALLIGLGGLIYSITYIDLHIENTALDNIVATSESIVNDVILLGAAIFFLVTFESRIKRKRTIKSLNELRVIAHVVDMHQLTKDPGLICNPANITQNSPKRLLSRFELERYLDYCSELTSLIAKVAALYAQSLPDQIVVRSVNEIETLCTGLCRKIWQKLIILNEANKTETNKLVTL